ncbi:MAG: ribosome biogenesis factor YjgA [Xanthomonadales bacterium]|jgi:ribosome-associated protein|nr:ribosome biogenesis factor YjgA [Xanthomonadales bacterium]
MVIKNMEESKKFSDTEEEVSRSQRRREALEVKSLAARLIALSPAKRARVPLDEQLLSEIERARGIRSNVARKRQLQYVAKLLRRNDTEPLEKALESFDQDARQLSARQHRSEAWRDHLLATGDPAVGALLEKRRDADAQAIRQLLRNARREASRNKPPAAARSLFKMLRALDEAEPLPPVS